MLQLANDSLLAGLCRTHGRAIIVAAALALVVLSLQWNGREVACPEASCDLNNSMLQSALLSF
jgi:hypothetical protein